MPEGQRPAEDQVDAREKPRHAEPAVDPALAEREPAGDDDYVPV